MNVYIKINKCTEPDAWYKKIVGSVMPAVEIFNDKDIKVCYLAEGEKMTEEHTLELNDCTVFANRPTPNN